MRGEPAPPVVPDRPAGRPLLDVPEIGVDAFVGDARPDCGRKRLLGHDVVPKASGSAMSRQLLLVDEEHVGEVEELRLHHLASLRRLSSWAAIARPRAAFTLPLFPLRIGTRTSLSPSVFMSSSVSRSMSSSSRMGFSMTMPRLFPMAVSFFRMAGLRYYLCITP